MITTTTNALCLTLWGATADLIEPDAARNGIYPDPDGTAARTCPYTGTVTQGWAVRQMTGDEIVVLRPRAQGGYTVDAESWVQDRVGEMLTGRDGRKAATLATA